MDASTVFQERPDEFIKFLRDYYKQDVADLKLKYPQDKTTLFIDHSDVFRWDPDVADDIRNNPDVFKRVFEHAIEDTDWGPPREDNYKDATVGFKNVGQPYGIPELGGDEVGDLVTVRGQIAKTSAVKPRLTVACLQCQSCHSTFDYPQPQHGVEKPGQCGEPSCKGKTFKPIFEKSEWTPHQLLRIKQPPENADGDQHIDVHVTEDLAGKVSAGDRVDLSGILKTDFDDLEDVIPEFFLIGTGVVKHESDYEEMDISAKQEEFEAIASGVRGDPYELLIGSIAPSIKGDEKLETIKLAIGLQLFGGWRRPYGDGRYVRGDAHVGIIGEAGTGKSSLLEAAEALSPRSGFVSGKNASQAGVTAAAVRDDFGDSEWSLEAGAVVKAHKGICCIDEIDKVDPDALSSLHTALEKQRLEFNKAGIDASLPCHTSVLAAGNPENGEFIDEMDTLAQLNLGSTLRSRFDLLFVMRERPDYETDRDMGEHMMKVRQLSALKDKGELDENDAQELETAVDVSTLRAWIAYAREHVNPVIEDYSLIEEMAEWYAENRETDGDKTMNRRMVEAIGRLCEASARVRLSETVEKEDIERAKKLLTQSLKDLELLGGGIDMGYMDGGVSQEGRDRTRSVKGIIEELQPSPKEPADIENVIETAKSAGHDETDVRREIKRLRESGAATGIEREGSIRLL